MPVCPLCRHEFVGSVCDVCRVGAAPQRSLALLDSTTERWAAPSRGGPEPWVAHASEPDPAVMNADGVPAEVGAPHRLTGDPGRLVSGVVVQSQGPHAIPPPVDVWRAASLALVGLGLFPIVAALWLAIVVLRVVAWVVGWSPSRAGGGRGVLQEVFLFRALEPLFRPREPVPVYVHIMETPNGQVAVRQEGEFRDGRVFVGHRYQFRGRRRGGVLIAREGRDETLGTTLSFPPNRWCLVLGLVVVLVVSEYLFLVPVIESWQRSVGFSPR